MDCPSVMSCDVMIQLRSRLNFTVSAVDTALWWDRLMYHAQSLPTAPPQMPVMDAPLYVVTIEVVPRQCQLSRGGQSHPWLRTTDLATLTHIVMSPFSFH